MDFKSIKLKVDKWANRDTILWILKAACICIFISRAWQHIFRDAPFRELFWKDSFITPFLNFFNYPANEWYLKSDPYIVKFIQFIGINYLVCAFSAFKIKKIRSIHTLILVWGAANLILLTYLIYLAKLQTLGIIIEYTVQWITPLLLVWFLWKPNRYFILSLKVAIALTFTGHGLYAVGYYQIPGHFVAMVNQLTPFSEWESVVLFLKVAGILDFIISVGIFIPRVNVYCLLYATAWGLLTAMARITAFFDLDRIRDSTSTWLYETVWRFPHGLIPLICLLMIVYQKSQKSPEP